MSTKRYFRITPGNWGGELTVGRVSEEFARYWIEREASDLPARSFRAWLLHLPTAGIAPGALDRFLTDLTATLESFEPAGPPRSGLICT